MTQRELSQLVAQYASGNISDVQHARLAAELKNNADSRRLFRELVDLEFGLAYLANEAVETPLLKVSSELPTRTSSSRSLVVGTLAIAASLIAVSALTWIIFVASSDNGVATINNESPVLQTNGNILQTNPNEVGFLRQTKCSWDQMPAIPFEGQFTKGQYTLRSGVAELNFNSGTTLTMEAPAI